MPSTPCTKAVFAVGNCILEIVESYKYLGLVLKEKLDYLVTAKAVAKLQIEL